MDQAKKNVDENLITLEYRDMKLLREAALYLIEKLKQEKQSRKNLDIQASLNRSIKQLDEGIDLIDCLHWSPDSLESMGIEVIR